MSTFSTNNSEIAKTALNQILSTEIESATKNEPNRMVSKKSKKKKKEVNLTAPNRPPKKIELSLKTI
jgi:hypothetical protein